MNRPLRQAQGRPLLITDCDEVLLHMVAHFDAWLDEAHNIDFAFESGTFGGAMTDKASGEIIAEERVWPLLDLRSEAAAGVVMGEDRERGDGRRKTGRSDFINA